MTRVLVTGGSGKLGRAVVTDLAENGYQVVNLDRVPTPGSSIPFVRVDLTDYGQVAAALQSVDDRYDSADAVVHLAAIPAPGLTTNAATFDNNITSTYHVFAAARAARIKTVVWASSETVLGLRSARNRRRRTFRWTRDTTRGRIRPIRWRRRSRRKWHCSSVAGIRNCR